MAVAALTKISRISAWVTLNDAFCAVLLGDLHRAADLLARGAEIEHEVNVVHRWSVALALHLGTLRGHSADGDLERARGELDASIDDVQLASVSVLAGAIAYRLAAEHRIAEAGDVLARVLPIFSEVEIPYWLLDAASLHGDGATRVRARELAMHVASRAGARPAQGVLAMIDAREALRRRRREESLAHAETAAAAFRDAGWTLYEAYALELAGRVPEALALFRRMGATAEVGRITHVGDLDRSRRRGASTLTGREREIAGLVVAGHPTRTIADRLVISERTVETHIAAIYRKLGVASRRGLETLLSGSAES
jgi:DNA-binding CsgD family transcriptional regulator